MKMQLFSQPASKFVILATLTSICFLASACEITQSLNPSTDNTPVVTPNQPQTTKPTIRIGQSSPPSTLDPEQVTTAEEVAHVQMMYEGLTKLDNTLVPVPAAADKWDSSADGKTWTFSVRKGLTYSDGSPLNAKRFVDALRRNIDPQVDGLYGRYTNVISGAAVLRNDKSTEEERKMATTTLDQSILALDSNAQPCKDYNQPDCLTLKIVLKDPANLAQMMSLPLAFPVKQELLQQADWWADAKNHVGNGPYVLAEKKQTSVTFSPNAKYWKTSPMANLKLIYLDNVQVGLDAFRNNELEIVPIDADLYPAIQKDPELQKAALIYPAGKVNMVAFNQNNAPFDDIYVRKAFSAALDRQAYTKDKLNGLGTATETFIPPGFRGHTSNDTPYRFDSAAAKAFLAQSKYKTVADLPEIKLTVPNGQNSKEAGEWLVTNYKKVFGEELKLTLNAIDEKQFGEKLMPENDMQLFIDGWTSDYNDPSSWLAAFQDSPYGFQNDQFDDLMEQATQTSIPAEADKLYAKAIEIVQNEQPVAYWYFSPNKFLVKPGMAHLATATTPLDVFPGQYELDKMTLSQ